MEKINEKKYSAHCESCDKTYVVRYENLTESEKKFKETICPQCGRLIKIV